MALYKYFPLTLFFVGFLSSHITLADQEETTRLLRFPDIYKQHVAFVYGGDIYTASIEGGTATRLTSDEGLELFPKFSPDGSKIAFSAEYSGNRQVYVMNRDGSGLKQLTYYNDVGKMPPRGGFDYRVMDWTPDGKYILVRANRLPWGPRMGRPILVPADGGMPIEMAVPEGGGGMLSPDGKTLVYTPIDREWRTWKRHRGGRAQDVWTYDLENNTSKQLTSFDGTDQQPVWVGDNIFFASDREGILNLYRHQDSAQPSQQTFHKEFDVLWPSAGPDAVVYQNGGFLYRFDPTNSKTERLNIVVAGERQYRQASFKEAAKFVDSFDISHDGKRTLIAARGELFTVPEKNGPIRNISNSTSAREISASWSPDGRSIVYLSDITGEYEVYIRSQDGKGGAKQLTQNSNIWLFPPVWAGSSDKIAWADKNQKLWIMEINGKASEIDRGIYADITHYRFSSDGRYLVYVKGAKNGLSQIWLYDSRKKSKLQLSDNNTSDYSPVFDPEGRYLYFLSNRDYNLSFSDYEFNYLYHKATRIYAVPLNNSVEMLGALKSDEVGPVEEKKDKESDKENKRPKPITLDAMKMRNLAMALNAEAGSYSRLTANKEGVIVLAGEGDTSTLKLVTIGDDAETKTIAEKIDDYRLAAGGEKILVKQKDKFSVIEAKPEQKPDEKRLALANLQVRIDPEIEWPHLFRDAWRILRDWFYDPNMHGQDWQKIYDKYRPLVDHVAHRADLDFILGEIAGEMNAGHIYVQSGDEPSVKRIDGGLLGADIKPHASGNFQITKVFKGENWHDNFRSPLTQTDVGEGEFITAVNGIASKSVENFYQLMENTAGRTTTLSISKKADGKNARDVLVKPIERETNLRYLDWVADRARYVEKISKGRVGYIHLPNTHIDGNRELFKQFLPQINKEALIIDDRYNGGGFIPDRMIEVLSRKPLNYWKRRGLEPSATPFYHHSGPKVMLVNGYSSSGGDALPYYFRKNGLGKIIGTRTWGGLIGISGNPQLADGGQVIAATFRILDTDGNWVVENEGVKPDIEVVDRPELIYQGQDPSIERAVTELLKQLPASAPPPLKAPPAPTDF
ncbi:protease [Exilibacterium tricleocarpae]|uniref:Tricorn protease homolog n=1 Tax=Exilibacterium tricleocarpae TaxID=2591008 RepID=A0A545TAB9_9GAMM|nr:S41 family peptidase [Exilibacterium tricleocarpae]TQV74160.1 protease [Exilibacterium tricleocarpae]